jgi:outer membrane protein assembly factor BamB
MGDVIIDSTGTSVGSFTADAIPSFHNGRVIYLKANTLTAVDVSTRVAKWTFLGDQQLCTSAVVAGLGGQVFVGSKSGNIYELDEMTGLQVSVVNASGPVTCASEKTSMGLARGRLIVPVGNTLLAY